MIEGINLKIINEFLYKALMLRYLEQLLDFLFECYWLNLILVLVYAGILFKEPLARRRLLNGLGNMLYIVQVWIAPFALVSVVIILLLHQWRLDSFLWRAFSLLNLAVFWTWCKEIYIAVELAQRDRLNSMGGRFLIIQALILLIFLALGGRMFIIQGWRSDPPLQLAFLLMCFLVVYSQGKDWLVSRQ